MTPLPRRNPSCGSSLGNRAPPPRTRDMMRIVHAYQVRRLSERRPRRVLSRPTIHSITRLRSRLHSRGRARSTRSAIVATSSARMATLGLRHPLALHLRAGVGVGRRSARRAPLRLTHCVDESRSSTAPATTSPSSRAGSIAKSDLVITCSVARYKIEVEADATAWIGCPRRRAVAFCQSARSRDRDPPRLGAIFRSPKSFVFSTASSAEWDRISRRMARPVAEAYPQASVFHRRLAQQRQRRRPLAPAARCPRHFLGRNPTPSLPGLLQGVRRSRCFCRSSRTSSRENATPPAQSSRVSPPPDCRGWVEPTFRSEGPVA